MWPFAKRAAAPAPARRREPVLGSVRTAFAASQTTAATFSWQPTNQTPDAELRRSLRLMRARSRQLCRDNDHARGFLCLVRRNVVGPVGIRLQGRVLHANGAPDKAANDKIEASFGAWSKRGTCTVDRKLSLIEVQRVIVQALVRDGEIVVRLLRGAAAGNAFGFALQLIEADHLDEDHVEELRDGRRIYMGVELDAMGAPVAYHLLKTHPGDDRGALSAKLRERVPAANAQGPEILHLFLADRAGQNRGIPWMHTAMRRLSMLNGYEEAELVASRASASKMGAIETPDGTIDGLQDAENKETGEAYEDLAEPGVWKALPPGAKLVPYDPQHPNSAFAAFCKAMLRAAAAGLGVSYVSLASDLEGVNYSSIRQGVLEEREEWRLLQGWLVEAFLEIIYREWLTMALLLGQLRLPPASIEKWQQVGWQARGWQWVDPAKEVKAQTDAVALGVKSRTEIAAEQGRDFEDVLRQLAAEKALAQELGITLGQAPAAAPAAGKGKGTGDDEGEPAGDPGDDQD